MKKKIKKPRVSHEISHRMKRSDPITENSENIANSLGSIKRAFLLKRDNESVWKNNEKTLNEKHAH